jgi:cytochrome P450
MSSKYLKADSFYANLGLGDSLVALTDPEKHRIHRSIASPAFAISALRERIPRVSRKIQELSNHISTLGESGEPIELQQKLRRLTVSRQIRQDINDHIII